MVDRRQFTPDGSDPDWPVPILTTCTVPTRQMAEMLAEILATDGRVLELGTGSGYQTAVLAEKCREVVSIELLPLPGVADKLPENVTLIWPKDGCTYDTEEVFDGVLVSFAAEQVEAVWVRQLREGARLVVPLKSSGGLCRICVFEKQGGTPRLVDVMAYAAFTSRV